MSCENRARVISKRGNGTPTIPASNDHTDNTWIATDIYEGEWYLDLDTDRVYTRSGNTIVPVTSTTFGNGATDDTDQDGASTNSTVGYATQDPEDVLYTLGVSDLPAGKYRFGITATYTSSQGTQRSMLGFYVNDVLVRPVVVRERKDSEDQHKYGDFAYVTFGALSSFNIELRGAVSTGTNTLEIIEVSTEYWRIS